MGFFSRLEARVRQTGSLLCVGLDPHGKELPSATAEAAKSFCLRLIDATADVAAAFKPNAAFFEVFGPPGLQALREVIEAVPQGVPVILDAKRGDIASTAEAYARAVFQTLGVDAVTASPYLGHDSLAPFLQDPDKGVFMLCKTSNPGAGDLQDLPLGYAAGLPAELAGARRVFEAVARLGVAWNTQDNLGLVVGATHPEALRQVRALAPDLWFLSPGVGAQGGDLEAALRAGLRSDGLGMLVPVSRAISQASHPAQAARELVDAIQTTRQRWSAPLQPGSPAGQPAAEPAAEPTAQPAAQPAARGGLPLSLRPLAAGLLDLGFVKFGQFTLKSGLQSPIYLDLRQLVSAPGLLELAGRAYVDLLRGLEFDRLAALPYAALPIGTAISLLGGWPMIYPRKEVKGYGTQAEIEGAYAPGERIVVIDDLATTGGSKFEAIDKLVAAGLRVQDVVVLIDRQSGADQALAQQGYRLRAIFTLTQLLDDWTQTGQVPLDQINAARRFIQETSGGGPGRS